MVLMKQYPVWKCHVSDLKSSNISLPNSIDHPIYRPIAGTSAIIFDMMCLCSHVFRMHLWRPSLWQNLLERTIQISYTFSMGVCSLMQRTDNTSGIIMAQPRCRKSFMWISLHLCLYLIPATAANHPDCTAHTITYVLKTFNTMLILFSFAWSTLKNQIYLPFWYSLWLCFLLHAVFLHIFLLHSCCPIIIPCLVQTLPLLQWLLPLAGNIFLQMPAWPTLISLSLGSNICFSVEPGPLTLFNLLYGHCSLVSSTSSLDGVVFF